MDQVIGEALRARAGDAPVSAPAPRLSEPEVAAEVARIQGVVAALPVLDSRPGDEILYHEFGLPK